MTKMKRIKRTIFCLMLVVATLVGTMPASAAGEPDISAESAIVIDYETGQALYEKDPDSLRVPASMTKVMTAYIIFEELEAGNLTLETQIPVSEACARYSRDPDYPTMVPLTAGSTVDVDTLLKLILIPSASASCIVAAEYISGSEEAFVERMNSTAYGLGMVAAYENCHDAFPHYITARSQALLIRAFVQRFPQILEYTALKEMEFNGKTYANTNRLLSTYYYEGADGFKTGTIPEAGYCLSATAVRDGRRIISVVMKADNQDRRHRDSIAILDYGFKQLAANSPVFSDIGAHWARDEIEELASTGTALHTFNGKFRPTQAVTRGEFAVMLLTAMEPRGMLEGREPMEIPEFKDLDGVWGEDAIRRAVSLGLVSGTGNGLFSPNRPITREQAMMMMDNAKDLPEAELSAFADSGSISSVALDAAARVTAAGIFKGNEGYLMPQHTFSRGEAAVVIHRLLEQ